MTPPHPTRCPTDSPATTTSSTSRMYRAWSTPCGAALRRHRDGTASDRHQCGALCGQHRDPAGTGVLTPFVIAGVGDVEALTSALDNDESVRFFRAWAREVGMGYEQTTSDVLELPAYTGPVITRYAQVVP